MAFIAAALHPASAQADVLQIGEDGAVTWRRHTHAVTWQGDQPAAIPLAPQEQGLGSTPSAYAAITASAAAASGISTALLEALIWQESRWHPFARSPKGAIGLGQLMPATAQAMGIDPRDPQANIRASARYLRQQLDLFGGNVELALAAYNAGPGRVQRAGGVPAIAETRSYVRAITSHLNASLNGPDQGTQTHARP